MEGAAATTAGTDERYAEWYVWAKREVSSEGRVCLGVAEAALEAEQQGADRTAVELAARRSVAGTAVVLLAHVSPWRQSYAQWYDWTRRQFGDDDPARLHRLTRVALEQLRQTGDMTQALQAARAADAVDRAPAASVPPWPPGATPSGGWNASALTPAAGRQATSRPVPLELDRRVHAGFWRRFAAAAVDGVICLLGAVAVLAIAGILFFVALFSTRAMTYMQVDLTYLALLVILVLLYWLYFAGLESSPGQATIGKRALGLMVVDRYGRRLSFGRATGRHFAKIISTVGLGIGYLIIGWTADKRGLHDLIAGTLVVRRQLFSPPVGVPAPPVLTRQLEEPQPAPGPRVPV